jgi:hypothetical protein
MNDRKFTVRKSRKSTKKGGAGKNGKPAKDDNFGGYQVDPVEESNQKIALIMDELMQAEEMKQNEEEGKTDLNTTFAYEDKVNQEEFKDLIAKTKAIMEEVEEEYDDEEDEDEAVDKDEECEGEENLSDDEVPVI